MTNRQFCKICWLKFFIPLIFHVLSKLIYQRLDSLFPIPPPPVVQKLVGSAPNNLNKCSCHDLVMVLFNIYCPFFLITILKIVNFPFVYITCFIKWIQFIVLIGMDLKSEVFVTTVLNESGIWSDRLIIFPMQNCTPRAICNKYSKPHIC